MRWWRGVLVQPRGQYLQLPDPHAYHTPTKVVDTIGGSVKCGYWLLALFSRHLYLLYIVCKAGAEVSRNFWKVPHLSQFNDCWMYRISTHMLRQHLVFVQLALRAMPSNLKSKDKCVWTWYDETGVVTLAQKFSTIKWWGLGASKWIHLGICFHGFPMGPKTSQNNRSSGTAFPPFLDQKKRNIEALTRIDPRFSQVVGSFDHRFAGQIRWWIWLVHETKIAGWGFPSLRFTMEKPFKMDDLGVPPF